MWWKDFVEHLAVIRQMCIFQSTWTSFTRNRIWKSNWPRAFLRALSLRYGSGWKPVSRKGQSFEYIYITLSFLFRLYRFRTRRVVCTYVLCRLVSLICQTACLSFIYMVDCDYIPCICRFRWPMKTVIIPLKPQISKPQRAKFNNQQPTTMSYSFLYHFVIKLNTVRWWSWWSCLVHAVQLFQVTRGKWIFIGETSEPFGRAEIRGQSTRVWLHWSMTTLEYDCTGIAKGLLSQPA